MEDEQAAIDAVLKFAVLALVIGAVLGLVTFVGIKSLGLGGGDDDGGSSRAADTTPSSLPTVALSQPGQSKNDDDDDDDSPSASATPKGIQLTASPGQVGSGQRINLTGTYPGADNLQLTVQRMEGGTWADFANGSVTVPVHLGTFGTYVVTERTGPQKFRVFDGTKQVGSNVVTVTVG